MTEQLHLKEAAVSMRNMEEKLKPMIYCVVRKTKQVNDSEVNRFK